MRLPWNRKESDLDRELRHHLESLADAFEREGYTRPEALKRARHEFGGVELTKDRCRDERRWRFLASIAQDITYGARMMRKAPAVTAAAILSLALGIGATTAILSLVDAVLWRHLGVPQAEQLTEILWQAKGRPEGIFHGSSGSMYPEGALVVADFFSRSAFDTLRSGSAGSIEIAGHLDASDVSTSYSGVTSVARLRPVSGNFFSMMHLTPLAGRLLLPSDDDPRAGLVVAVSDYFWRRNLQGDSRVIGRSLRINNRSYTIAGILPREFGGIAAGDSTDLYTTIEHAPIMLEPKSWEREAATNPESWFIQLLGRRSPDATNGTLTAELDTLFRSTWPGQLKRPETAPSIRLVEASGGIGGLRRELGNPLILLFTLVACVLLIACANIANLTLARADTRRKEVALRVSLGCSQGRLIRQFFTESVLLAFCGGLLSLVVAYFTVNFAVTLMPGDLRLAFEMEPRAIVATLALTALTALLFGLYPAWRAARVDAAPALKEGSGSVGGVSHGWLSPGKVLVFAQVALAVLLVAAGAAFNAHLRQIVTREAGFERTRLLMFDLRPGESGYRDEKLRQFYTQVEQRLLEVPGVESAGLARIRPMKGGGYWDALRFAGYSKSIPTGINFVSAGYLSALGVPILSGRGITEQDVRNQAAVAVVSEDVGQKLGRSPLGMRFQMEDKSIEVVGVSSQARYSRLTEQPTVVYLPNSLSQDSATVLLRTAVSPSQVLPGVRSAIARLDANLPIVSAVTMQQQIATTLRRERLFAWLCGAFGVLALLLCMIGLYGVMSYAISRRTQEIGIRMALGASPGNVWRHIAVEGLSVAIAGCLVGTPVAWWVAQKYVDYKRLGMQPLDPAIFAWATAALAAAALLAVLGPAFRAASADPMNALREG